MQVARSDGPSRRASRRRRGLLLGLLLASTATSAFAFAVYGAIGAKWDELGGAGGPLGQPLSDESPAARGGRFNAFQNGFIYWLPIYGAHAVYGAIGAKWNAMGREAGYGYPLTDELPARNGGRFNDFENGGSIYWSQGTGAQAVYGDIRVRWDALSRERGPLGYPVTSEQDAPDGGRYNDFQNGAIYWKPTTGSHAVYGRIGEKWREIGGPTSACGYPVRDEEDGPGRPGRTRISLFEHGSITWHAATNLAVVQCGRRD